MKKALRYLLPLILFVAILTLVLVMAESREPPHTPAETAGFPLSLKEVEATPLRQRQLDVRTWTTAAGSRVLFMESRQLPILQLGLTFAAGAARDGHLEGLAATVSSLLDQGAEGLDVDRIAAGFEDLGAGFGTASYNDMAAVTLATLSAPEFRDPALELMEQVLRAPTFPQDALDRFKAAREQSLRRERQVPGPQLAQTFQRALFGDHPYGGQRLPTEDSLPRLDRAALVDFHRRFYTAGNAVFALVGDLSEEQARSLTERLSAALPPGPRAPALPPARPAEAGTVEHVRFPSSQTHLQAGQLVALDRSHPDYVPLLVGVHIFGGGSFTSILMDEVRQKRGLVYGAYAALQPMAAGTVFSLQLQTASEQAQAALDLTRRLLADYVATGPTDEQLSLAIQDLTASFALSTASNSAIQSQLAVTGFYDLPQDHLARLQADIATTTREQVQQALRTHLHPDRLVIASIGPEPLKVEPLETAP